MTFIPQLLTVIRCGLPKTFFKMLLKLMLKHAQLI